MKMIVLAKIEKMGNIEVNHKQIFDKKLKMLRRYRTPTLPQHTGNINRKPPLSLKNKGGGAEFRWS